MFDNSADLSYNQSNDVNDAVVDHYLNRPVIVKMDEQRAINDPDCKHELVLPDPEDTIGDAVLYMCQNPKCGRGYYLRQK